MRQYSFQINGLEVNAEYSERAVREIFLPLLKDLTQMQREKGRRILVMLAAPPGAGKSTLAHFLEILSKDKIGTASAQGSEILPARNADAADAAPGQSNDIKPLQAISIDGFHLMQEYLLSHSIVRDGTEIPMVKIKGAPPTFDLEKLTARIRQVLASGECGWPVYDRLLHDPVEDAVTITGDIVLLEGNYLLLDENGWRDLRHFADYTIFVTADEEMLRKRLVERRMKTGVSRENSEEFVDFSDMANVRICLEKSLPADLILRLDGDDYQIVYKDSRKVS